MWVVWCLAGLCARECVLHTALLCTKRRIYVQKPFNTKYIAFGLKTVHCSRFAVYIILLNIYVRMCRYHTTNACTIIVVAVIHKGVACARDVWRSPIKLYPPSFNTRACVLPYIHRAPIQFASRRINQNVEPAKLHNNNLKTKRVCDPFYGIVAEDLFNS